jgi:glycosyltransferase involved in cell wall biosynthesis
MTQGQIEKILKKRRSIKAIFVTSYIPRKCGIATFTKDLTNGINLLNPFALAEIMALNRPEEHLNYPWEVKFKICQNDLNTYLQAADYINESGADVIMLEHEFGLYGGKAGEYVVPFMESIKKPIIVTCHTVIDDPTNDYGVVLKRVVDRADALVVMMEQSQEKLVKKYGVPRRKIAVIPHGTPDLPFGAKSSYAKKFKNRIIFGNINLLSESKGVEYSLEATAILAKKFPNILCLIVGQTHPVVLEERGEKYRKGLLKKVRELGIQKNVKFINRYVTLQELLEWLKLMDYYVTPYLDPQQSASGALAYAIGAGKPCVSTPYVYAKEVLSNGRGMLVPFRDAKAIAEALTELEENPEKKELMQKKAYDYGRLMTWVSVGLQHLDLFDAVIKQYRRRQKTEDAAIQQA